MIEHAHALLLIHRHYRGTARMMCNFLNAYYVFLKFAKLRELQRETDINHEGTKITKKLL